jgi:hypothetical protein
VLQFFWQARRLRGAASLSQAGRLRPLYGGSGHFFFQETAEGGNCASPFPFSFEALIVSKTGACCLCSITLMASTVSSTGI